MPLADDDRPPARPSPNDVLRSLGELPEVEAARMLPGIAIGLLLAIPIFVVVAVVLGLVVYGLVYQLVGPASPIAGGLGLAWFGGSLALTAVSIRPLLRRVNAFLIRRSWPTIH